MVVWRGDLLVGGEFTSVGNVPIYYVARWDGISWKPLGSGINYIVNALAVYGSDLVAGGLFYGLAAYP